MRGVLYIPIAVKISGSINHIPYMINVTTFILCTLTLSIQYISEKNDLIKKCIFSVRYHCTASEIWFREHKWPASIRHSLLR